MYYTPMNSLTGILANIIAALMILILIDAVVSNLICVTRKISPYHPLVRGLRSIVDPILNPIRRILPPPGRMGNLDISPIIAIVLLNVIHNLL